MFPPRALGCLLAAALCGGCDARPEAPSAAFLESRSRAAPAASEWRSYLGDAASQQWSPLREIHPGNVASLTPAWEYATGSVGQIQTNPLVVEGVLYGVAPNLDAFALDAATGAELWRFSPGLGVSPTAPNRGLAYWTDGAGDERIFLPAGPRLHALDARTGAPIPGFGDDGAIALREGLPFGDDFVLATTPPGIHGDLLIQPIRVNEVDGAAPGHVRAFDARTGAVHWTFRTIPQPGETGHETWPPDAWERVGGANNWAGVSIDPERGLVFVPTGSAAYDFYGGDRAGDNLFANTLLALDAATGERRWHYQVVRHDLWDRDLPAPPNLISLEREGRRVDAVAQITKSGHVFVFERETGEPLFPIDEVPVRGAGLPGEHLPRSQPVPRRPPPFARQTIDETQLTRRSPEANTWARERLARVGRDEMWDAPDRSGDLLAPGMDGGGEWGGAAWDPETRLLYVNANDVPYWLEMMPGPDLGSIDEGGAYAYLMVCASCHGLEREGIGVSPPLVGVGERLGTLELWRIVRDGRGRMPGFESLLPAYARAALVWHLLEADDEGATDAATAADLAAPVEVDADGVPATGWTHRGYQKFHAPDGLPAVAPPWGTLTAIDLQAGEIAWQVPLGNHPELAAQGILGTGAESYGGPVVTAGGLVFIAAASDGRARAFDKRTGELLWEHPLPFAGFATPAVYEADGRQFVVFAAGGGKLWQPPGDRYVAFALPLEGERRGD